jgi:UDP:flavonoid glycosyltransferase YjiC (YdhE family)
MKVLFAVVDGGGNIPPQLAVARALQARGVQVLVLGHRGIRDRVEAAGLVFEPFADGRHFDPTIARSLAAIMTAFTRVAADRRLGQCVTEAARRHDVDAVVVDMILVAGISEIVDSGVPMIVFVHCFYRAISTRCADILRYARPESCGRECPRPPRQDPCRESW